MKKYSHRLNIISAIKDEIIDRCTEERFALIKKREERQKRKKLIPIISLAAALALIMGAMLALFIPMLTAKQVPIYTGMTASGSMPNSAYAGGITPLSAIIPLDNENFEGNNGNHGSNNPNKKPAKDIIEEEMSTEAPETTVLPDGTIEVIPQDELYYAKPNEDIFITIHFDNPDEYKIMSFKLNGKAYADYMFEYGSDYENIIIKVNVGDVEGLIDYTIDAIQYADRETLKYVEMKGDPTLTIGVATEKQPVAEVTDELIGINEMSFKVNVTDELELIKLTDGKLYAVLTDGEALVEFKEFKVSELTEVKFENLKTSTYYEYAIVAQYDALDGEGFANHILYSREITTREVLAFSEVTSDKTSISFTTVFNEDAETKEITAIELYLGEKKVRDIALDATVIEGLLSGNEYKIVISYLNKGETEAIEYKIRTVLKETPTVELSQNGESTQTSFEFDLVYTDIDEVGQITKIELLHGNDEPIVANSLDVRTFENLLSNNGYTVRVTFTYDLNDGVGERTATKELTVKTKAKAVPDVGLSNYVSDFHSVSFGITELSDPDNIGEIIKAELYNPDGTLNRELELDANIALNDLILMEYYNIAISFQYDANDGRGTVTESITLSVSTAASEGFEIRSGKIYGIGTCQDTVLYINKDLSHSAFEGNTNITKVIFANNVTSIGIGAFEGCTNLEEVVLGKNLVTIRAEAFKNCESLSGTVDLSNVEIIYNNAFEGCIGIEKVILSESIKILGMKAFMDCTNLLEVINISKVKEIEASTFWGCESLSGTIDLSSAKSIGAGAFKSCENLTGVIFGNQLESISDSAFYDCKNLAGTPNLSSVKIIGSDAFVNCKDISGVLDLSSVEEIYSGAFNGCKKIEGVTFGNSLKTIGDRAFMYCEKLSGSLDLSSAKAIWSKAFYQCTNLNGVKFGKQLETIESFAFSGCQNISGEIDISGIKSLGSFAFSGCSNISGTVDLSGLKTIEASIFDGCSNLEGVILNSKLKTIGGGAFSGCKKLSGTLNLSAVETIGEIAFYECENLEGIILGSNLEIIGKNAFNGCLKLSGNFDLSSVESIGGGAFANCINLQSVTLGSSLEEIEGSTFAGCSNLTVIGLSNIKKIGLHAFDGCAKLSGTIDLSSAEVIEAYAFKDCANIDGAIFGTDLQNIEYDVFDGLKNVYYMGSEDQWENSVIRGFNWNALGPGDYTMHYNYNPS